MKSPFPGMDPYLEAHWGDVHHSLIQYTRDALHERLPEDLYARAEERVFVQGGDVMRHIVPDVHVAPVESWSSAGGGAAVAEEVAIAEPFVIQLPSVEITEGFIEIRAAGGGELITVIEFLSPTNKGSGAGGEAFEKKQSEVLRSRANLVEIDLLRGGRYVLAAPAEEVPASFKWHYRTCISVGWDRTRFELYQMPLRRRLPILPIPLRPGENRVPLDLQALLDHAYTAGRYRNLDYSAPLIFPLEREDAAWAETLLAARTK